MSGTNGGFRNAKGVRRAAVVCGVSLVLALGATIAGAAPSARGHHEKISPAPVDLLNSFGDGSHPRAGFVQHAPTNLGHMKQPKGATNAISPTASSYRTNSYRTSARRGTTGNGLRPTATRLLAAIPAAPTISTQPTNPTYDTSASFSFIDSDATATFACSLDNSKKFAACASPKSYPGPLSFGSHTFRVRAINASGTSATAQYTWTVQAPPAPPAPTIDSAPPASTNDSAATFLFSDTAPGVSFDCQLDRPKYATCASPKSYTGLAAGTHTFTVRARNASGTGGSTSFSWTITQAPAPVLTAAPTNPTTDRGASFSFTESVEGAIFQCRLDGSSFSACTSPKVYAGPLAYGVHTFRVHAVFGTGTSADTVYSWTAAPPAPTIDSQPANPTSEPSGTFTFSDTDAGLTFACSLDNAAFAACASPKTYAALTAASHTFQVRAVSSNGTQSAATSYAWTVLPPIPPTPVITSSPSNPSTSTSAAFAFTDNDPSASFECSIDSGTFGACTSPKSYLLANGGHTFAVRAANTGGASDPATYSWTIDALQVKMRLLVVSGNGDEQYDFASNAACSPTPCKGAIQTYLDEIGVPYDTLIGSQTDPATLAGKLGLDGTTGNYAGIILATGNLVYFDGTSYPSGFTADEWQTLWDYEAKFHVRQVTSFTSPGGAPDTYGLTYVGETGNPVQATLTDAGKQVFSYLNPAVTVNITNAYTYLATTTDPSVTPLLTTADGDVIASTRLYADGRENLEVGSANAPWELHTKLLSYGIVNWLTRGVFLGSRHVTIDPQVDDLLIDSDIWNPATHSDAEGLNTSLTYRLNGTEFQAIAAWQSAETASNPLLAGLKLEWAFNGEGAFGDPPDYTKLDGSGSTYPNDTLTPALVANQGSFCYINHTYQHENVDFTSYDTSRTEIVQNQQAARALGLGCYSDEKFVQPDISGLTNSNFLQAAWDSGVRYLITDTSQPGWGNPSPNAGFTVGAPDQPILAIPRHPSNLFYNLQTKEEWVDEYNFYFCTCGGSTVHPEWKIFPEPKTYDQIVDSESNNLLSYLLSWDIDPWMFHQANFGRYDGQHSLFTDLLDATLAKYTSLYNLPILGRTESQVGEMMTQRMAYDASGVDATLVPCQSMTLTVQKDAAIPITGVTAGSTETYGGQPISTVAVTPGSPVTIPVRCS
jgi:hypothetical protein